MPSKPQTGIPPQPPSVRKQQSPVEQYAQGSAEAGGPAIGAKDAARALVSGNMTKIAELLTQVAKVTSVEQPELMPIITRVAGGCKVFETEFNKTQQGQGSQQGQSEPTPGASEDSNTAIGM